MTLITDSFQVSKKISGKDTTIVANFRLNFRLYDLCGHAERWLVQNIFCQYPNITKLLISFELICLKSKFLQKIWNFT